MAIGGLWTIITLVKPMLDSVRLAWKASRKRHSDLPRHEQDFPIAWVAVAIALFTVLTAALFAWFVSGAHAGPSLFRLLPIITVLTVLLGLLMASACGYMAALLGSSCSPISGIGILTTILIAAGFGFAFPMGGGEDGHFAVALTLFIASIIVTVSSIANDNLQDLKTGSMVGAAPWRQQAALAIGVVAGAVTIAPVLQLLYSNYGFVGSLPHAGMQPQNAMPAPQATLITQIANGIIHHELPWSMVYIGAALGAVLVILETAVSRRGYSFPALTVGIGIYLPYEVSLTIALGAVISWFSEKAVANRMRWLRRERTRGGRGEGAAAWRPDRFGVSGGGKRDRGHARRVRRRGRSRQPARVPRLRPVPRVKPRLPRWCSFARSRSSTGRLRGRSEQKMTWAY